MRLRNTLPMICSGSYWTMSCLCCCLSYSLHWQDSPGASAARQLKKFPALGAYSPLETQHCRFSGYELQYALYAKFPS